MEQFAIEGMFSVEGKEEYLKNRWGAFFYFICAVYIERNRGDKQL